MEIIIAFFLISLFSIPLIRNPIYFCISQIKDLEKLECERIAELTFLDVKLAFLKKQIDLKNMAKYEEDAEIKPLKSFYLDTFKNKEVKRSYKVYYKREKQTPSDENYRFVHIKIFLLPQGLKDPYVYKYKLTIKC